MTDDELIKLADKAGLPFWKDSNVPIHIHELRKFVELVVESKKKPKAPNSKALCDND
jgi:hypothetical protein